MRFDTELIAEFFMDLASFLIFCAAIYVVVILFFKFKYKIKNNSNSRTRYYSWTKYSQYNNNRSNKNHKKSRRTYKPNHKYPETYSAVDGHNCKSLSEKIIDDYFFKHGIKHLAEDYINIKIRKFKYDWYLPDADVYVEFFGYQGERYNKSRREKEEFYKKLNLKMIAIEPKDLLNAGRFLKRKFQKYWFEIVDQSSKEFKADFRNMEEIRSGIKLMDEVSFFDLYLLVNNEFLKRKETRDLLIKTEGKFHRNKGKGPYVARYFFNQKSGLKGKYERDFSITKTKWLNNKDAYEAEFRGSVEVGTVLEMRIKAEHQPTRGKEYRIVTSNPLKILKKISWREAQKLA